MSVPSLHAAASSPAEVSVAAWPGPVGASNSRPSDTSGTPSPGTYEAGIDTARFLFRVHDWREQRRAEHFFARPSDLGPLKAGYLRGLNMLWVEGRPATLYEAASLDLLPASGLPDAQQRVAALVADEGDMAHAREIGVSRVDVTASIAMGSPAEGWALLRGLAALDVPRRKPQVIGRPVETVYWMTEAAVKKERAYDKGLQLGIARPGERIRLEAQTRPTGDARTTAGWWMMERVRETFESRFGALARAAEGLHVSGEAGVREKVREFVQEGTITPRQAELLLGHVAAESVGIPTPRRTRFRRKAELRRLGLAQALDGIDDDQALDVDLGAVLEDVITSPAWLS